TLHAMPTLPGVPMPSWAPRFWKRFIWWLADRLMDREVGPGINALRIELGLPPVRRIMASWWNSPERILGLFPDWYAPVQPDWPEQLRLADFPLYDERGATATPERLREFLDAGDPPV